MILRGFGWIPDEHDSRDHLFGVGAVGSAWQAPPQSAACTSLLPPVLDQGGDQSCVVQGAATLVWAAHKRDRPDETSELLARKVPWYLDRKSRGLEAWNLGMQIRSAFKLLNAIGFCRERHFPHTIPYDQKPGPRVARLCDDQRKHQNDADRVAYASIFATSDTDLLTKLKDAIATGYPVVGGWPIVRAFARGEFDARYSVGPPDEFEVTKGHLLTLHAYEGDKFRARSSWGEAWADGGDVWLRSEYVVEGADFWVVLQAPSFSDEVT